MVLGKLLILVASGPVLANNLDNPRFFEYSGSSFVNRLADLSFGWFRTLKGQEHAAYHQSLTHAVFYAENGESVKWYTGLASGSATPVATWPTGSGYCRRIHIQTIAYGLLKTKSATACFENAHSNWRWISDK